MKDPEQLRSQEAALAQIDAIAKQVASGELTPTDADAKMTAIMQDLQRETSRHLAERQTAHVRQHRLLLIIGAAATAIFSLIVYKIFI